MAPPDGVASPRTRSADSIPATTTGTTGTTNAATVPEQQVSTDPPPATAQEAKSIPVGVRYSKQGADRGGNKTEMSLTRLDANRVEVTLDRGGKKTTYVLDLSKADARQAYDDLSKLRTTRAELLSAKPTRSGVQRVPTTSVPGGGATPAPTTPSPTPPASPRATIVKTDKAVEVKGGVKPKFDKTTKGGEANVTVRATKGPVQAEVNAKAKVELSKTTKIIEGSGDASVKVASKDGKNSAGVVVKQELGQKTDIDASGKKTVTTTQKTAVHADAQANVKLGKEENLDWSAAIDVNRSSVEVKGPDGQVNRTEEESRVVQQSAGYSDSTGPDQQSVKVTTKKVETEKVVKNSGGATVTDNLAADQSVNASLQRTKGETVISASGDVKRNQSAQVVTSPDGQVSSNVTDQLGANGQLGVADKTGPVQGSVTVKGSVNETTKVVTDGKGAATRTDTDNSSGSVIAAGTVKGKDGTVNVAGQVDASQSKTVVTTPDGNVSSEQKGSLGGKVDLTTTFQGDRKVGFSGSGSREYTLTVPRGASPDQALPLDAAAAQKLPEGSTFTLTGKGKLGITGEADGFKAGVSDERSLQIKVQRQAGTQVTATVDLGEKRTDSESFNRTFGDPKKLNAKVGLSNSGNAGSGRTDQFTFDLSNPAHQKAYDSLMRGDLSAAQGLGVGKTLKSSESSGNEQMAKVGISFQKLGASAELLRKDIDPSDDRIQKDPTRKAVTDAALKDGKEVRWIERGGAWEIGGGYSYGASPGVAGFGFGVDGKKAMEWRSLGPKVDGEGGAPGLAMSADEAEKMPAGSEFSIRGESKLSGRASVLGGWQAGGGGVTVSAGVSFDASKGRTMDMNVRVKKLPDGKVEVRLDELKKDQASAQFSAKVGATVNASELAAAGGSVLGALAKKPDVAAKLADLSKNLSVEFKAGKSHTEEEGKGLVFTLDLNEPDARAAYEKLVRGNPEQALDASGQTDRGVKLVSQAELASKQDEKNISLKVGKTDIFSASDSRKDVTAQVVTDGKTERLDESIADRKRSNIFGRRRSLNFDAVSVRTDKAPTGEKMMRLTYEESDRYTSKEELAERRALAKSLGARPVKEERIQEEKGGGVLRWISGAHNDHGKVSTSMDVSITSAGIGKIRGAGREAWLSAYGQAVQELRGGQVPAWNDPAASPRARELLDGYRSAPAKSRDQFRKQYEQEFGKEAFKADVKSYARAAEFADALGKSSDDVNPAAWNKTFADLAQKMGFNFFDSLAAMNKLAGESEVVVTKFSMQGRAVDIEMAGEGTVNRPQVSAALPGSAEAARLGGQK